MSTVIANTERLIVRKMEVHDLDDIYQLALESLATFTSLHDESFWESYRSGLWDEMNAENIYNGSIFLKETGEFVGKVCMQYTDRVLPELGIDILKAHQNQGYGPEAVAAFCNWYSEQFGLQEVQVRISSENSHSIHIFEKLGAEYQKLTSLMSQNMLELMGYKRDGSDLPTILQNCVREYVLHLPIKR